MKIISLKKWRYKINKWFRLVTIYQTNIGSWIQILNIVSNFLCPFNFFIGLCVWRLYRIHPFQMVQCTQFSIRWWRCFSNFKWQCLECEVYNFCFMETVIWFRDRNIYRLRVLIAFSIGSLGKEGQLIVFGSSPIHFFASIVAATKFFFYSCCP